MTILGDISRDCLGVDVTNDGVVCFTNLPDAALLAQVFVGFAAVLVTSNVPPEI